MTSHIYSLKSFILASALALLTACSGSNEWTVDGRIEGAEGEMMLVEASDNGRWYPIDSVLLDEGGHFKIKHKASGYPDIYRLRLGDKTLYFPIDSIETVTVIANADAFDSDYTLSGSAAAEMLMTVDRRVLDVINGKGVDAVASDSLLKRELGGMLLGDPAGIVSYYIINKRVGSTPLFNPANKADLKIIGAVANAFSQYRPNDPRTTALRNLYLSNRVNAGIASPDTLFTNEIEHFDINLYDNKGEKHSLTSLARDGKVVILNFINYASESSPALNVLLNSLYTKYHDRGLEIYQISLDEDEHLWRQAALNLPWITVYNPPATGGRVLLNYNVESLPTTFILDRQGIVVERVENPSTLESTLQRYL